MTQPIRWGILAPGSIAHRFATDLRQLDDATLVAVGSRALDRAEAFARQYGAERAYGSYEELATDPNVDAIYLATPHPWHMENAIMCLEAGKAVLCEKPMAVNARQAHAMVTAARDNNAFLMEANWTRFLPVTRQVVRWIQAGRIGQVRMATVDFGFRTGWNPEGRLLNPDLAGGAILDVGVYVITYASMVFGDRPATIKAFADIGDTGVDEQTAMVFRYADGELALLSCAVRTSTPQVARIDGTDGRIVVDDFWHATSARLEVPGKEPVVATGEAGYQFEAAEVGRCLRAGQTESDIMPLDESIAISETMDAVRRQIGLRYPFEH